MSQGWGAVGYPAKERAQLRRSYGVGLGRSARQGGSRSDMGHRGLGVA